MFRVAAAAAGLAFLCMAGGVVLSEAALRVPAAARVASPDTLARNLAASCGGSWSSVEAVSDDGVALRGWLLEPQQPGGGLVLLLHGIADTRRGVLAQAQFLVAAGYSALAIDLRGHGASGGGLVTFGLKEKRDVSRWIDWAEANRAPRGIYALGESLGASVVLQALSHEHRFRAVVAECPFSDFHRMAYDRVGGKLGIGGPSARVVLWPLIEPAFVYVRAAYGLNLDGASAAEAIRQTRVPVLLIHGDSDDNIPVEHSRRLRQANPATATLWEVPGAPHTGALARQPEEFKRRVLDWFGRRR